MTRRQELFCKYYAGNGFNGTNAAIKAGYGKRCASVTAYEILSYPHIKKKSLN